MQQSQLTSGRSVAGQVLENAVRLGAKPAIVHGGRQWSYDAFGQEIARWRWRIGQCVGHQGVVLIFMPQTPEAVACFFGVMAAGAIPSFMPLPSAKQEPARYWAGHAKLLDLIEPAAIVTVRAHAEPLARLCAGKATRVLVADDAQDAGPINSISGHAPADGGIALLQHSSGTTGLKKGVALSHEVIFLQLDAYSGVLGATADDVVVSWLPTYHDMGLIACTVMPMLLGQTLVLLDPFDWVAAPATLFEAVTRHGGHWVWLPNFAFEHLRRTVTPDPARFDLAGVKAFIDCSEPCKATTFDRFAEAFAAIGVRQEQLQVCYAMAETVFAVSQTRPGHAAGRLRVSGERLAVHDVVPSPDGDVELLSCGQLLPGCEVHIEHAAGDGYVSPVLNVGEIVVSAPFLFSGYHHRPEITAKVLAQGRYRTRDLGFVHAGELYVLGRKDDLLISNGRNYFAHEVEQLANGVEGIKAGRNVAVGVFNAEIGSEEIYLVQEHGEAAPDEARRLRRRVREVVQEALGLALRDVVLVPPGWLVKTTSGKISRDANKTKLADRLAARARQARPQTRTNPHDS